MSKYTVVFEWPDSANPEISIADTWKGGRIDSVCFDDALSNIETFERQLAEARTRAERAEAERDKLAGRCVELNQLYDAAIYRLGELGEPTVSFNPEAGDEPGDFEPDI